MQKQQFQAKSPMYSKELFSWQGTAFFFVMIAIILNVILAYGVSLRLTGS